ncbi:MAG: HD domain-containing protein, partial [bacterium]|nr:HD domain-containing protein [bacterium]
MKNILNFLIEVGELKKMPRRGWVLRGIKNPETIAAHTFRMTIMSWILCRKKKLNLDKVLKMCLIHDICEVRAGDATPYDNIISGDRKQWKKVFDKWPRFSKKQKEKLFLKKYKKEHSGLKKLIVNLPPDIKKEIYCLWD